jgi:hypothetical protein
VPTTLLSEEDAVVDKFIARYGSAVTAVLSGFDRLVFRGTLLPLVWERGMHTFLARAGVRLLDFVRAGAKCHQNADLKSHLNAEAGCPS